MKHPVTLLYLSELIGEKMRLDHEYAILMRKGAPENRLHGGGTPFDPSQYYHFRNEKMHNGLTVVIYALADAGAGDGGFCCIPGSHKSNFRARNLSGAWRKGGSGLFNPFEGGGCTHLHRGVDSRNTSVDCGARTAIPVIQVQSGTSGVGAGRTIEGRMRTWMKPSVF